MCTWPKVSCEKLKLQKRNTNYSDDEDSILPNIDVGDLSKRMSAFRADRAKDPRKTVTTYRVRIGRGDQKNGSAKAEGSVRQALSAARQQVNSQDKKVQLKRPTSKINTSPIRAARKVRRLKKQTLYHA